MLHCIFWRILFPAASSNDDGIHMRYIYKLLSTVKKKKKKKEKQQKRNNNSVTKTTTTNNANRARRNIIVIVVVVVIIIKPFHRLSTTDIFDVSPGEHESTWQLFSVIFLD